MKMLLLTAMKSREATSSTNKLCVCVLVVARLYMTQFVTVGDLHSTTGIF